MKKHRWIVGLLCGLVLILWACPAGAEQPAESGMYRFGCRGENVRVLQERLIELGYLKAGNATGYFGSLTRAAVKSFQRASGLKVDGVAGPKTLRALYPEQEKNTVSGEVYRRGSRGEGVRLLQSKLVRLGYMEASRVTGYFGTLTQTAVRQFQRDHGLLADGIAGQKTKAMLEALPESQPVSGNRQTLQNCGPLYPGSWGSAVRELQENLQWRLFYKGEITGEMDEKTVAALKSFQKSCSLAQTGLIDEGTRRWLLHNSVPVFRGESPFTAPDQTVLNRKYALLSKQEKADVYLMAQLISAEFGSGCYEGQVAVGNVVMNRVKYSGKTISQVIFEKNQFSPARSGKINRTPNQMNLYAAIDAYFGADPIGECRFFNRASCTGSWSNRNRTLYRLIGGHAFFY